MLGVLVSKVFSKYPLPSIVSPVNKVSFGVIGQRYDIAQEVKSSYDCVTLIVDGIEALHHDLRFIRNKQKRVRHYDEKLNDVKVA